MSESRNQISELVAAVEAVGEFGKIARRIFLTPGVVGAVDVLFTHPRPDASQLPGPPCGRSSDRLPVGPRPMRRKRTGAFFGDMNCPRSPLPPRVSTVARCGPAGRSRPVPSSPASQRERPCWDVSLMARNHLVSGSFVSGPENPNCGSAAGRRLASDRTRRDLLNTINH